MIEFDQPLTSNDGGYYNALLEAAVSLVNIGEFQQAQRLVKKALQKDKKDPQAYILNGQIYELMGDLDKAEDNLRKAVKQSDRVGEATRALGVFLLDHEQVQEGIESICQYIEEEHWKEEDVLKRIAEYARKGGNIRAIETLKQAWENTLDDKVGYIYALAIRDRLPNDDAVRVFEIIAKHTKQAAYWNQLGISFARQDQLKLGIDAIKKAIASHLQEIGLMSLFDNDSQSSNEEVETDSALSTYYANLSRFYLLLDDGENALSAANNAIRYGREIVWPWLRKLEALESLERYDEAVALAEKIIEQFENQDIAQVYKSILSVLELQDKSEEYTQWFAKAVDKYPEDSGIYSSAFDFWIALGKYEQAISALEKARNSGDKVYERFLLLYVLGKTDQAWEVLSPEFGSAVERFQFFDWLVSIAHPYGNENLAKSKTLLLDLLNHAPQDSFAYVLYTSVLLEAGDYATAEDYLKKAIPLADNRTRALLINNMAYAQLQQKKLEEAKNTLESIEPPELETSYFMSDECLYYGAAFWHQNKFYGSISSLSLRYTPAKSVFIANRVAIALAQGKTDEAASLAFTLYNYEPETDDNEEQDAEALQVSQFLLYITLTFIALAKGEHAFGMAFLLNAVQSGTIKTEFAQIIKEVEENLKNILPQNV